MKTIREVYEGIFIYTAWEELVRRLDESGLPFTGRNGPTMLILAADGLFTCERQEHREEYRDTIGHVGWDEPPLKVRTTYHPGYTTPVLDHAVLRNRTPEGHIKFAGRHFVEVAHGTVCDYDVTKEGYLVWLEGEDGPHPVPMSDAAMFCWLEDNGREKPDEMIGEDMWYDGVHERYYLKPLYEEVDPVTEARID